MIMHITAAAFVLCCSAAVSASADIVEQRRWGYTCADVRAIAKALSPEAIDAIRVQMTAEQIRTARACLHGRHGRVKVRG